MHARLDSGLRRNDDFLSTAKMNTLQRNIASRWNGCSRLRYIGIASRSKIPIFIARDCIFCRLLYNPLILNLTLIVKLKGVSVCNETLSPHPFAVGC